MYQRCKGVIVLKAQIVGPDNEFVVGSFVALGLPLYVQRNTTGVIQQENTAFLGLSPV